MTLGRRTPPPPPADGRDAARLAAELGPAPARLRHAERVLVLTGAGISVSAGLPTYRGPGGLYGDGIPDFVRAERMPELLPELWDWHNGLKARMRAAEPTPAHRALATWIRGRRGTGAAVTLITTNLDDLHERAGTDEVHHLHGRAQGAVCLDDGCAWRRDDASEPADRPCDACGGRVRPTAVLFGEQVDLDALWAAKRAVRDCDAFLAIGTSASVYPASGLTRYARDVGAFSVVVNPDPAAADGFDEHVALDADAGLEILLGA